MSARLRDNPGGPQIILRAFLGVTFTYAGLQKLTNRFFFEAANPGSIQAQLHASITTSPIGPLIRLSAHDPVLVGLLIAFGELAVGLGTLFGLFGRVAAAGGMAVSLLLFLSVSFNTTPYFYGSDIVFFFAWTPLLVGGSGAWSVDFALETLHSRERAAAGVPPEQQAPDLGRRAAVRKLASALTLASFAVITAAIAAAVGRMAGGASVQTSSAAPLPQPSTKHPAPAPRRARPLGSPATCRSVAREGSQTPPRESPPTWCGPPRALMSASAPFALTWAAPWAFSSRRSSFAAHATARSSRRSPAKSSKVPRRRLFPAFPSRNQPMALSSPTGEDFSAAATGRRTDDPMASAFSRMLVVINLSPGCH